MLMVPITTPDVTGEIFGEIYGYETNTTIAIADAGIANKAQITAFTMNGHSSGMTCDHANDHIVAETDGIYMVNVSITAASVAAGGADDIGFGVFKNNGATQFENLHANRTLAGGAADNGSIGLSGIVFLNETDTVEVWVWNYDSGDDVVIDDIDLSVVLLTEQPGNPITGNPIGLLLSLTYS